MKILVIGSGGREHALCWKLAQSPLVTELYCTPGNPGIAQVAECLPGDAVAAAQRIKADFVVVGPDAALADGVVDKLAAVGIAAFGPTRRAAQLESSKIFCKNFLAKYNIPTGASASFDDMAAAKAYVNALDADTPIVVKADGLAAGKGVVVAAGRAEALEAVEAMSRINPDNSQLLIEEYLSGPEVSLLAITDGTDFVPLAAAQDHKRIGDGDSGANTGGMGCYSPVPAFTEALYKQTIETIIAPTVAALKTEGIEYRGVLYAGLMLTQSGPKIIEYNCRFGDPETQVVLPRLQSDLLPLLLASAGLGAVPLGEVPCAWSSEAAVCVIMSSAGYPGDYRRGDAISGLMAAAQDAIVFQAGTAAKDGTIVTNGGRVLGITGLGAGFAAARATAYGAVEKISFAGAHYRKDIGWQAMGAP